MGKKLSEETVESDSDESMQDALESQSLQIKGFQKNNSRSAIEEESTSTSSDSESDDESSDDTNSNADTKRSVVSKPSSSNKNVFVPPSGFRPSKLKTQPSPAITSALSNLKGKQIFHITAPSYLPMSEIKEMAFGKAMLGEPILSHKGVDYGLVANAQQQRQGSEALLVFDEKSNNFVKKEGMRNIESYNIQEIVRLPGLDSLIPTTAQEATTKQPAPRPHPKHLRMRFHPIGSKTLPAETVGSSSESESEEPTFRIPTTKTNDKRKKDHKRKPDNQDAAEERKKKSKKEQFPSQADAETESRRDKEKKNLSKNRDEASEERRARKEDKKKRKAEKGK